MEYRFFKIKKPSIALLALNLMAYSLMRNICIIGFGSIGKYVFKNLIQDNIKIKSLICRHGREEEGKQALCSNLEIYNS